MKLKSRKEKLQYIWDYYKFPLLIGCIILYVIGYLIYGKVTHKEDYLYLGFVNVSVNDMVQKDLTEKFLVNQNLDIKKINYLFTLICI
ncbi:hypothetical protein P261_01013 [Lachnospiraceae bacterium TWA4]|nr:hypothetical protein P261_01013 [Lachnospiraceae bacterium TWA4]